MKNTMTRTEAEAIAGDVVALQLQRAKITAEMELKITSIREQYEGRLDSLTKQEAAQVSTLREWADANPHEFPKDTRSITFVHARIGLRTNPPKVEKIGRKLSWDDVLNSMRRIPGLRAFIRTPPDEINKAALIDARETIPAESLQAAGIRITQGETFFVEPVSTAAEGVKVPA